MPPIFGGGVASSQAASVSRLRKISRWSTRTHDALNFLFNGIEMASQFGVGFTQGFDLFHGVHHAGVIAVPKVFSELWIAATKPMATKIDRDVTRLRHRSMTIFAKQIGR